MAVEESEAGACDGTVDMDSRSHREKVVRCRSSGEGSRADAVEGVRRRDRLMMVIARETYGW